MKGYIKGLSYDDANRAIALISSFVKDKLADRSLDLDERLSWKEITASIATQSVAVYGATQDQIHLMNVVLDDNECGFITSEPPFLCKSMEEKAEIIHHASRQHLAAEDSIAESTN